jgi:hypothetical protein
MWQASGGDFAPVASAVTTVSAPGPYKWLTTAALLEDVAAWLESPEENHGWILVGDESTSRTAKRFDSREHPTPANRPMLRLVYRVSTASESDLPRQSAELVSTWPNPFSDQTRLDVSLDRPGVLVVEVFDVTGRMVADLSRTWKPAGRHAFRFDAGDLPPGLYVARAQHIADDGSGESVLMSTMVLAR